MHSQSNQALETYTNSNTCKFQHLCTSKQLILANPQSDVDNQFQLQLSTVARGRGAGSDHLEMRCIGFMFQMRSLDLEMIVKTMRIEEGDEGVHEEVGEQVHRRRA